MASNDKLSDNAGFIAQRNVGSATSSVFTHHAFFPTRTPLVRDTKERDSSARDTNYESDNLKYCLCAFFNVKRV